MAKVHPKLSWNPIRYIHSMLDEGTPTLEEWFAKASEFDLEHVELYNPLLDSREPGYLEGVRSQLESFGLTLSMLTCAPDFTHPDEDERHREFDDMLENLEAARILGAPNIRTTAGCHHDEVARADGGGWCSDSLKRLADIAEPYGINIAVENHYRDRRWTNNDFVFHADVFLEVWEQLKGSRVRVNFDMSNQLMVKEDPLTVLEAVKHHLVHIHANDRLYGSYQHCVVGEGKVDFEPIFRTLSEVNYTSFISLEDGTGEGDEGTRKSLAYLRKKNDEYYP